MGNKSLFISAVAFSLTITGCGKDTHSAYSSSSKDPADRSQPQHGSHSGMQPLVVYKVGVRPSLNEFQATNVEAGKPTFDFTFTAEQDGTLTLPLNTVNSTLLGCDDSDVGIRFSLYRAGSDGTIDLSGYSDLGPSPIRVTQGTQYFVRVTLFLERSCLGLDFKFGIEAATFSLQ